MEITAEQKNKIREQVLVFANRYSSKAQCAHALGINVSQFSGAITHGKTEGVLSDANWINIAALIGISLNDNPMWRIAGTKVVIYLTEQFEICRNNSMSGIFCDITDCGKTTAARHYAAQHKGIAHIDCSRFKCKMRLIPEIARQFGVQKKKRYWETFDALVWQLNHTHKPLIILDEAGDLQYEAFLEVKALWNASEYRCGWFMLGADALRVKMERGRELDRVGFHEMFSRYGARYQSCIAKDSQGRRLDLLTQAAQVAKLNAPKGMDIQKLVMSCESSLRRIYNTITKSDEYRKDI